MKLDSLNLNLYIENFLPGIVILISLLILLPIQSSINYRYEAITELLKSEFILGVVFLSVSYLLGLVSAITSRSFVDWTSEMFTRPLIVRQFSHLTYDQLKASFVSLPDEKQNWRKAWNEAYRASLKYVISNGSENAVAEVMRRREQGRIIRNLFFTLAISSAAVTQLFKLTNGWVIVVVVFFVSLFVICLYSYAEYSTFSEAILHLPETRVVVFDHLRGYHLPHF